MVAEVAQAHEGSLGNALAYVDAVAAAGADVVKFQTHIAAAESTPDEPWRVRFSPQDESRYAYWRRMEFTEPQWTLLAGRARERGIGFVSSPFSEEAFELLERVGVDAWKVASGEVGNVRLLDRMAASGRPVWLSTGMSDRGAVHTAVERLRAASAAVTVFQCTSLYPTPPEKVGLNLLAELRTAHPGCAIGLSDHSGTIFPGLAAVALGVDVVEVHVCFSRATFGPDVPASVTLEELALLVRGIRFLERARAHPVDKDAVAQELAPLRTVFGRSVVAGRDLARGAVLTARDLVAKKPGGGLPPDRLDDLVGRRLARDVRRDERIAVEDVEA
ncbi:MAG: N-acetylneuraminate synthase family protein [Gemmatimonadetes bacterium]|nr:N-acetylneuraminate synthase family protein [Gemmatimonadota bacterium]